MTVPTTINAGEQHEYADLIGTDSSKKVQMGLQPCIAYRSALPHQNLDINVDLEETT